MHENTFIILCLIFIFIMNFRLDDLIVKYLGINFQDITVNNDANVSYVIFNVIFV